jgi:atypical dual specificity phosphatase
MPQPFGFTWVEKPLLAAMARPEGHGELQWLRQQGIQVLVSLTEDPLRRDWINEAGLMAVHIPMTDMEAPSQEDLDRCIEAITKAHFHQLAVGVHCGAGLGRTGVVLACVFVTRGLTAKNAIARVRRLRPGSIETEEQVEAVEEFAQRHNS